MTIVDDIVAQLRRGECSAKKRHDTPCSTCDEVDRRIAYVLEMASTIEALRPLHEGATPAPWEHFSRGPGGLYDAVHGPSGPVVDDCSPADAALVSAMRNAIASLLARPTVST